MTIPPGADYADPITLPISLTITLPQQPARSGMSRLRPAPIATAKGWADTAEDWDGATGKPGS